jgi:group I intron endonuclease
MLTYIATNITNGKFYIGSTKNFEKRKKGHSGSRHNYPFQNSLRKDPSSFTWQVFEDECDDPILEQALLDQWFGVEQCYNLNPNASHPPSCKGRFLSEETRKKIGRAHKGKITPESTKKAVSLSNKTRKLSPETLKKKSDAASGANNPFFGKRHTEETRKAMSDTRKGKKWWYNPDTEESKMSKESPGSGWHRGRSSPKKDT